MEMYERKRSGGGVYSDRPGQAGITTAWFLAMDVGARMTVRGMMGVVVGGS